MSRWIKKWNVEGSNGKTWIVSVDKDNEYGCSCPIWKFKRQECHHIKQIKNGGGELIEKPEYVLATVLKPTYDKENNRLLIPLIGLPDAHLMEATICYYLLKYGYSMSEIRELRNHLPQGWSAKAIINHVETHGEAKYPEGWYRR